MDLPLTSIHPHSLTASKTHLSHLILHQSSWPESKLDIHQQFEWTQLKINLPICQKRTKLCVTTKKSWLNPSAWKRPASCRLGTLRKFHPLQNFSPTVWREADSTVCCPALGVKSNPQNVLMRTYFVGYLLVLAYSKVLISWQHITWSQCVCVCCFVKD